MWSSKSAHFSVAEVLLWPNEETSSPLRRSLTTGSRGLGVSPALCSTLRTWACQPLRPQREIRGAFQEQACYYVTEEERCFCLSDSVSSGSPQCSLGSRAHSCVGTFVAECLLDIQIKKKRCLKIYAEHEIQIVPVEILVVTHSYIWNKTSFNIFNLVGYD